LQKGRSVTNHPHILSGSTMPNLLALVFRHRIAPSFTGRMAMLLFGSVLTFPIQLAQKLALLFHRRTDLQSPIFIIGHWRSGTTYLHYLLARDTNFVYPTNLDVFMPGANLIGPSFLKKIFAWRLPKMRPVDNIELRVDSPQEEEFAIACLSPQSFYHGFSFPTQLQDLFKRYVLFKTITPHDHVRWQRTYLSFLDSLKCKNKTLLLKNPVNTARLKILAALFPDARFIYLYRNPAEVIPSTYNMLKALIEMNQLQVFETQNLMDQVRTMHRELIKAYEEQRMLIKNSNLIEINYSDLVANPMEVATAIYKQFNIPLGPKTREVFRIFIEQQKKHKPATYTNESWAL
jgi:omega-hydroxy-beta-dihydromenaquinone-9 sulfotransferase